jgi:hypothetical protein
MVDVDEDSVFHKEARATATISSVFAAVAGPPGGVGSTAAAGAAGSGTVDGSVELLAMIALELVAKRKFPHLREQQVEPIREQKS